MDLMYKDISLKRKELQDKYYSYQQPPQYHKIQSNDFTWLIQDVPNKADFIFCCNPVDQTGFSGATLNFRLMDNSIFSYKGPWHSNAESLYYHTKYDIRHLHASFGFIYEDREFTKSFQQIYKNVIYIDKEPQLGYIDRLTKETMVYSRMLNKPVYLTKLFLSGSSDIPIGHD